MGQQEPGEEMIREILTSYKADVSDHVAGLKKLKGEEADRAKAMIEQNEKVKSTLDDQIKSIGKVSAAIAGIAGAYALAKGALNSYAEHAKLTAATVGVNFNELTAATKGLKSEHELLANAARMNSGAFKLSTDQMAIAERAMIQFTRRGIEAGKAQEAILQAVTALKIDGLKDLGVFVDTTGLKMENQADRGKILERVLESLTGASNEFAKSQRTAAEDVQAAGVRIENATDRLKSNVGKGVNNAILNIEDMGKAVAKWWGGPTGEDTLSHHITYNVLPYLERMGRLSAALANPDAYTRYQGLAQYRADMNQPTDPKLNMRLYGAQYKTTRLESETKPPATAAAASGAAQAALTAAQALARFANASTEGDGTSLFGGALGAGGGLGSAAGYGGVQTSDLTAANSNALTANWKDKIGGYEKSRQTFMESTFGPVGQFDAYKAGWDGFTGAVTAGYGAMVDGTMSFGKAFKQAVAGALKATGAQMLIESLKEAAYGVANLAVGNAPGAAAHFKSSALFAAGSIAAGVAANQLGGSGAGASAGGGAGASAGAPRAPAANENSNPQSSVVVVYGDPFDMETNPRRRQNNAKKLLDTVGVNRSMGGSY